MTAGWPGDETGLAAEQERLADAAPDRWTPEATTAAGASYICFERGAASSGRPGERGWAGASRKERRSRAVTAVVEGRTEAPYIAGRLALREGPLREAAVRRLLRLPDVLLVDATGRDHPRRAGLALHLGAVLDLPSVGVTDRPLVAAAEEPADRRGATCPLGLDGDVVGYAVRTRPGVRPVFASAGWRTTPEVAVEVVLAAVRLARTPQVLREARRAARSTRGRSGG